MHLGTCITTYAALSLKIQVMILHTVYIVGYMVDDITYSLHYRLHGRWYYIGKKDKRWVTKHYTENLILSNTNHRIPLKTAGKVRFSGRVDSFWYNIWKSPLDNETDIIKMLAKFFDGNIFVMLDGRVLGYFKCGHRNVLSKRQVWMSIFHFINLKKKKSWTHGPGFF
jgi:hypothetical protein